MGTLIITFTNGTVRKSGYYYSGVATLAGQDILRMRYSGMAHIQVIEGGKIVIDTDIK
jgi:hypothetical protein